EAQGEQGDRGPVAGGEDGFAPGPCRDPSGAAAPLVQGRLTLSMASHAQLLDQLIPLGGRQPGQCRDMQPGTVGAVARGRKMAAVTAAGGLSGRGVQGVVPVTVPVVAI